MVFINNFQILPLGKEHEIEKYLPEGFTEKEKAYELGDAIEVYEYYYPDSDVISVIFDYYNERIIIVPQKVSEILDEIEEQILDKIAEKHDEFDDDQLDYNYCIEVFYPDYWTASSDDHSFTSSTGYWDYLQIELYRPKNITSSLLKIEKMEIAIPVWVNIGAQGTKIVSVCSDSVLNTLAKILDLKF